ncbi:putative ribonuclease H protein [Senna tora]|uniref:Putative ribonuclease H protein n=1 Tax=Senna tora TaxID=362788 RepID=A0A834X462_9FABA|nr:putative ribonuclease H protein [Senna tora]
MVVFLLGTTSRTACGGVARDYLGNFLASFTKYLGDCSVLQAELYAIANGLEVAWSLGFRKVVIESDSLTAVNLLKTPVRSTHPCAAILFRIQTLSAQDWLVSCVHVLREGNMAADAVAAHALTMLDNLAVFTMAPAFLTRWLKHDSDGNGALRSCVV